jgi:HAL2 family 3'(2'),5'-bisphosphate nucleotidase
MNDPHHAMEAAKLAVARACVVCRSVQRELDSVRAMLKDDNSPVTVADYASQAVVVWTLTEALGQVVVVGEESATELRTQRAIGEHRTVDAVVDAVRRVLPGVDESAVLDAIDAGSAQPPEGGRGFWTLDPIDGTKGFLRKGQYAVSLAWIEDGRPTLGVLGCPNLSTNMSLPVSDPDPVGSIYLATAGGGVYEMHADDAMAGLNEPPIPIRRLPPADGEPIRLCESIEAAHTCHNEAELILERLGEAGEPIRLDGQGKYAVVARGQADLYLRLPRPPKPGKPRYVEKIWDHAAGALVAAELGCAVSDARGESLDFGHGRELRANAGIIVAEPKLHGRVMAAMQALGISYSL